MKRMKNLTYPWFAETDNGNIYSGDWVALSLVQEIHNVFQSQPKLTHCTVKRLPPFLILQFFNKDKSQKIPVFDFEN